MKLPPTEKRNAAGRERVLFFVFFFLNRCVGGDQESGFGYVHLGNLLSNQTVTLSKQLDTRVLVLG